MNFIYRCCECQKTYPIGPDIMTCPSCSAKQEEGQPLKGILEVDHLGSVDENFEVTDMLPIPKQFFPRTPVGNTPLWQPERLREKLNLPNLFIKDDSFNPTGSFKDRASLLVAAFAKKSKIKDIVIASTGNAASSMAGIGASAGLNVTIFLPKNVPQAKMVQSLQYEANVVLVDGNYDDAYEFSLEYSKIKGGLNRNTAYNPMTIEGKKTVSLEIYKQLQSAPDHIFVPVGDGVILSGVYKGFRDLFDQKLINKIPIIHAIQAENSSAICKAFDTGKFSNIPAKTIADSICVDVPRCGILALKNLIDYKGQCCTVSDIEILQAQKELSSWTGIFTEPAGATSFAGLLKQLDHLDKNSTIVLLATGNGLKDINSAIQYVKSPDRTIKSISEII